MKFPFYFFLIQTTFIPPTIQYCYSTTASDCDAE